MQMKNKEKVILFKCHFLNDQIIAEYRNLALSSASESCDVIMLYDNSKADFKPISGVKSFLFTEEDFHTIGYPLRDVLPKSSVPKFMFDYSLQWFHADYPVFLFYQTYPEYHYYWQVEFDVRFNGNWEHFFSFYHTNDADFISSYIVGKEKEISGKSSWTAHNLKVDESHLRVSPFPVTRFSNRALILLDREFKKGACGYCEVITPSLLNIHNYTMVSIDIKFCTRRTFQFTYPIHYSLYAFYRLLPWTKNRLFHPVREKKIRVLVAKILDRFVGLVGIALKTLSPSLYGILKPYFPNKVSM